MAKNSSSRGVGTSRIRFILVEAEMADGDVGQITQAIQNALKGPAPTIQRIATTQGNFKSVDDHDGEELAEEIMLEDDAPEPSKTQRPRAPRRVASPNVLEIDLTTDMPLLEFATKADPQSHAKRFLVIAAWFKEHRDSASITVDHIYTGYRHLKWPTGLPDFGQPLRNLKRQKLFSLGERGQYEINHLGLQEVADLMKGKG